MTPSVSVIVPFYNSPANGFMQCLASIQSQSHTDWECLCVDDGSTDESPKVVAGYAAKDPRFRLIRQPNGGPGVARNTGLAAARGSYFTFVDADDVLHPQMLEALVRCAEKHGADLTLCAYAEFTDEIPAGGVDVAAAVAASRSLSPPFLPYLLDYRRHHVQPWAKLYRADRHGAMRFPVLYRGEDLYALIDLYARSQSLALTDEPLYFYRTDGGSLTRSGLRSYQPYIAISPDMAAHYEGVALAAGCDPATRVRLVRKAGTSVVMLYLFEALTDRRLSRAEKRLCTEQARAALKKICGASVDRWRAMPLKYWYLYPTFVKCPVPGFLGVSLVVRNVVRWVGRGRGQ